MEEPAYKGPLFNLTQSFSSNFIHTWTHNRIYEIYELSLLLLFCSFKQW